MVNCKINKTRYTSGVEEYMVWDNNNAQNEYRQDSVSTSETSGADRLCLTSSSLGEEEETRKRREKK